MQSARSLRLAVLLILAVCQTPGTLLAAANASQSVADSQPAKHKSSEPTESITEADRIARLQETLEADEKALDEQQAQLKKRRDEEERAANTFHKIADRIENLTEQLKKAKAGGNAQAESKLQAELDPLQSAHELAKEQFDLAVQARKTAQEQVATLEARINHDSQALAKLQGLEVPPTQNAVQEAAPPAEPKAAQAPPAKAPAIPGLPMPSPAEVAKAVEEKKEPKTQAEKEARKKVEAKETALADLERDLEKLGDSKDLLEKSIELESQTLETARQQYDNLEKALEAAETNFNDRLTAGDSAAELDNLRQRASETQQQMRDSRAAIRTSTDRLQDLRKQLSALQSEEVALVAQTEKLQRQAEAAKRGEWLVIARQYAIDTGPKLLVILVVMIVLLSIVKLIAARTRRLIERDAIGTKAERKNRSETLIGVFQTSASAAIVIGGVLMMLDAAGIPIALLLGGAGVVGLTVAFAAQSLIKDYFCGFLLLLENQFKLGDMITIGDMTGYVERMTLRITVLRNFDGHVYYIPNGQITAVKNQTTGWARVVLDIGVAYKEQADDVIVVLMQVANELKADPEHGKSILGEPEMFGVDQFADSSVIVKLGLKVRPQRQWAVKREMLRRIKQRFDELGIEIPFPQRTVHHRMDNGAPPPVLGQSKANEKN